LDVAGINEILFQHIANGHVAQFLVAGLCALG
jgi:hypothetical protein